MSSVRTPLALILAAVLVAPTAAAGFPFLPTTIDVAPTRAGDAYRYERTYVAEIDGVTEAANDSLVVLVHGSDVAADRFGVARAGEVFQVHGPTGAVERCVALAGGVDTVRRDVVGGVLVAGGSGSGGGVNPLAQREQSARFDFASRFNVPCPGRNPLGGATLRADDRLDPAALAGLGLPLPRVEAPSAPGVEASYLGRDALLFAFEADGGWINVTLADGLPGVAAATLRGLGNVGSIDTGLGELRIVLAGYRAGDGGAHAPYVGALVPERHPDAATVPDAVMLDDAGYRLPFTYAQALSALRADPSSCVGAFLADHPDARLARASYDRTAREPFTPQLETDGAWSLDLVAGKARCSGFAVRLAPPAPAPHVVHTYPDAPFSGGNAGAAPDALPLPDVVASSGLLARLAAQEGVEEVRYVHYQGLEGRLDLGDVPMFGPAESGAYRGRIAHLDAFRGGLDSVVVAQGEVKHSIGFDRGVPDIQPRASSAPAAAQTWGIGLGALGVLAALALLVKLALLPFYTRLRRATLLDNPLRARLYERVRAEPGIHQAELVDFAGVGRAATARHLDQLARHGFVARLSVDGLARYYAAGEVPPSAARDEAILRAGSNRAVYDLYAAHPDLPLREAARRLGLSAPTVHRAKRRLEKAGLLPAAREASVTSAA